MQADNIQALLDRARDDEQVARILLDHDGPEWAMGFHLQQAVEKILKALLIGQGANPPKKHDILLLTQLLANAGVKLPDDIRGLDALQPYAVAERYGDVALGDTVVVMEDAFQMVERLRLWATTLLSRER